MDGREYIKKVEEERKKAESLAIQFLKECEQQGISEYTVYCLPITWKEVEVLQKDFFPDMTKEEIMHRVDDLEKVAG